MATLFHWHNSPIWPQLQALGFTEHKTYFQGVYVGHTIAERETPDGVQSIELLDSTVRREILIKSPQNGGVHVFEYVTVCEYSLSKTPLKGVFGRGKLCRRVRGAYKHALSFIA